MKILLFLSGIILFQQATYCQSYKYRNYKFDWPKEKPTPIPIEEEFKNEDAVILEEKCIYNIAGNKVPLFHFLKRRANYFYVEESNQGLSPVIQKHIRIKFLTPDGIKKYASIVLPESFDPSSDWNIVKRKDCDSLFRPKGEFECIRYFSAKIIKPDGRIAKAIIDESTQVETNRVNHINEKVYSWIFRIPTNTC